MCAMRPLPNGFWLPVCIAKVIGIFDHRVTSMPRLAFEGLEPCDGKLSRRVFRGLGVSPTPKTKDDKDALLTINSQALTQCIILSLCTVYIMIMFC